MTEKEDKNLITRAPVVVILGHVDHGKSSILEAIKNLKITEKESGGITQHIGAYEIEHQGKKITFIDTPGHEAFSAMRSRGAKVADVAVLVVAADEGVKEQTKEAISHIEKAKIPMVVAINKMDKPEANPEKVKRELAKEGVIVESMGGKVPSVELSAKTKKGISDLLELILLIAEMEELKADISRPAQGVVIESFLDNFRGPTATLILKEGILKKGEIIGTSSTLGRARILEDFQGKPIKEAYPSQPVRVIGFNEVPMVGEVFNVFKTLEEAERNTKSESKKSEASFSSEEEEKKSLNLILKTDVLGSLEAIEEMLKNLPLSLEKVQESKITLKIIKKEVGDITESDIKLAKSANAIIVGFKVKVDNIAKNLAIREKIKIRTFDVIYELKESIKKALEEMLEPEIVRADLGKIKILAIFRTEKNRQIIGGRVIEGKVRRGALVEVIRNDENIGGGKIVGLKKQKEDINEATKGTECGILYEGDVQIDVGDVLAVYVEEKRKIELK